MPTVSAAWGCSPQERTRSPHDVWYIHSHERNTITYMAKWIGPPVKMVSPTIGSFESSGRAIVGVVAPLLKPDGTITSVRRKDVRPRATRLMTTPATIWLIWNSIESQARRR